MQDQPKKPPAVEAKARLSTIPIRFSQLLLLALGLGWAWFNIPGGFDTMQIPGFLIAMAISWWLTPEIRARAVNLGLVDHPGEERRIHKTAVPRLGGVAIYISVMTTVIALIAICGRFPKEARGSEGGLAGIAVGGTLIFVLGLLDDLESLPAKAKLMVQIIAACVAYSLGVRIKSIPIPAFLTIPGFDFVGLVHASGGNIELHGYWGPVLTVLWLVGIANAVNLIDGMDGLAAGVSAISSLTLWSVALAVGIDRPYAALAAAVMAGALLGFLRWNFNPARIFMGDSGAYLTGFVLAAISIMGVIKVAAAPILIVPLILFFPILDTTWAIVRRLAKGRSPFEPDAGHIHHRLLQAGLSQKKAAYIIYLFSALLGLVAATFVHQQMYFLYLIGAVLILALFFSEVLNRHRQRRSDLPLEEHEGAQQQAIGSNESKVEALPAPQAASQTISDAAPQPIHEPATSPKPESMPPSTKI